MPKIRTFPWSILRRGSARTMWQTNAGRNSINRRALFSSAKLRRSTPSSGPKSDTIQNQQKLCLGCKVHGHGQPVFDEDFGPFFIKFCSYFPYNAKLCLNGPNMPNVNSNGKA